VSELQTKSFMTNKHFQIKITSVRNRKPVKKVKETSEALQLEESLMSVLSNPLLDRLPMSDVLRMNLTYAVRDLAKGDY